MRAINKIILHCSATRANQEYSFQQCRADHRRRGWRDIGYHYYITRDGLLHIGRPLWQSGAHCKGNNRDSIGVCYEGGLDEKGKAADTRTPAQCDTMWKLLSSLHVRFPKAVILGHRDLSPDLDADGHISPEEWVKQCPSFDVRTAYFDLEPDFFQ